MDADVRIGEPRKISPSPDDWPVTGCSTACAGAAVRLVNRDGWVMVEITLADSVIGYAVEVNGKALPITVEASRPRLHRADQGSVACRYCGAPQSEWFRPCVAPPQETP